MEEIESVIYEITEELVTKALENTEDFKWECRVYESRMILEEIVGKMEHNIDLKATYHEKCRSHNQYDLMNLLRIIVDYDMDDAMYEALTFRESLIISKLDQNGAPTAVGGICVNVEMVRGEQPLERRMEDFELKLMRILDVEGVADHMVGGSTMDRPHISEEDETGGANGGIADGITYNKLLVHVASQFDMDGVNAGSNITSWVDRNMHTIEELRREFVNDIHYNEKSLYMGLKKKWYYVKHTSSMETLDERKLYSLRKAKNYISEGANIILLRYLAITKHFGRFELACAYINGDLCRNIYDCFGSESAMVNDCRLDVYRVKRTIIEECGLEHICVSVLTLQGQLIKQEWEDCDYVMHVNPHARLVNGKPSENQEVLLKDYWLEDMQMLSAYLDQQNICLMKNKSYMIDHPELQEIISDYVNEILMLRPNNILEFTLNYFGIFDESDLPRNEYIR